MTAFVVCQNSLICNFRKLLVIRNLVRKQLFVIKSKTKC